MRSPAAAEGHGGGEIANLSKRESSARAYLPQTMSSDPYVPDARPKVKNYQA